jgi:hypothetical protein
LIKTCIKCKKTWVLSNFYKKSGRKNQWQSYCKFCVHNLRALDAKNNPKKYAKRAKLWRDKNPDKVKNNHLKAKFGITLKDFNRMRKTQNYKCFGCKRSEKLFNRHLCVDHCHKTGKIRALLCNSCNGILGKAVDKKIVLLRLSTLLKKGI